MNAKAPHNCLLKKSRRSGSLSRLMLSATAVLTLQILTACSSESDTVQSGVRPDGTALDTTTLATQNATAAKKDGADSMIIVESAFRPDNSDPSDNSGLLFTSRSSDYPTYPSAERYRIGGENGLKIVVFETTDSFADVDAYFSEQSVDYQLERSATTLDYVKYTFKGDTKKTDTPDPWDIASPGIVIHTFLNSDDAVGYGASPASKTNIIVSYR